MLILNHSDVFCLFCFFIILKADLPASKVQSSIEYIYPQKLICKRLLCNIKRRPWALANFSVCGLRPLRQPSRCSRCCRRRCTDPFISPHFSICQDVERATPLAPFSVRVSNQKPHCLFSMNVFYFALGFCHRLLGYEADAEFTLQSDTSQLSDPAGSALCVPPDPPGPAAQSPLHPCRL